MKKNSADKNDDLKNAYKQDKLSKIPSWIKILLLKYWVAGAAFYFFGMAGGFLWGGDLEAGNDTTIRIGVVVSLGLGLFIEYMCKPIVRMMRTNVDDTYRYNMINLRGVKSLLLNIIYAFCTTLLTMSFIVNVLNENGLIFDPFNMTDYGVDPFVFGFVWLLLDFIGLFIKNSSISIYKRIRTNIAIKNQQKILDEQDVPVYGEVNITTSKDNFLDDETNEEDKN